MKTSLRRLVVVLATTCAVLLSTTSPASAALQSAKITGGTLTLFKVPFTPFTVPLGFAAPLCPDATTQMEIDSGSSGSLRVTAPFQQSLIDVSGGGTDTHFVKITRHLAGSVAGTYDHATGVMTNLRFWLILEFYDINTPSTCAPSDLVCTLQSIIKLGSTDFTDHSASHTVTLSGQSLGVISLTGATTCPVAPWNSFVGGTMQVSGLKLHWS